LVQPKSAVERTEFVENVFVFGGPRRYQCLKGCLKIGKAYTDGRRCLVTLIG
jgi:hypothetical protein